MAIIVNGLEDFYQLGSNEISSLERKGQQKEDMRSQKDCRHVHAAWTVAFTYLPAYLPTYLSCLLAERRK